MNSERITLLDNTQIGLIVGGVGGVVEEPTIEDLINLAKKQAEITRWRLGIDG